MVYGAGKDLKTSGGGYSQTYQFVENCTFVKTVLMLIVVLYHSIVFWGGGWFSAFKPPEQIEPIKYFAKWLNSFHVYGFVLTSGYLYSFLRFEKGKYQKYGPFLKNKAKRLLIPYAFIAIVWVIPIGQVFFHNSVKDIVKGYLLGTGPSQLWFLLMLFGVFAIVWGLSEFIHKSVIGSILLSGFFYVIGYAGSHFIDNYFMIWMACLYLPLFILGMKYRDYHANGKLDRLSLYSLVCLVALDIILFVLQQAIVQQSGTIYTLLNIPLEFLLHLVGGLASFVVLQKLANHVEWKESKLFMAFAKISLIVYLLHQQLVYITIAVFNDVVNPYINMTINFVIAIAGAFIIAKLLMTNKYTRFLVGEK